MTDITTGDKSAAAQPERRAGFSGWEQLLGLDGVAPLTDSDIAVGARAVLYLRVSTQRQMHTAADIDPEGNSIATQRELCAKRCKHLKAPIAETFVEPGNSAQSIAKRPVFRELISYIEQHSEVGYVVIYMRSRIFRNQADAAITKRILANMGVKLISAKEEFGDGYMADAMEAITDIMNEVQVRQSGEDIKNKLLHKAKNGGTVGRAKLGYLNIRKNYDGRLVNTIGIDTERAPLITWAFERYATGDYSLTRLQRELAEQGLTTRQSAKWAEKPVSRSQLGVILRDPYYLGMVTFKGNVFPGRHEALVTPEVFERVQQVLTERLKRGQRDLVHNHFLRGMLRCGRCHTRGNERRLIYSEARTQKGHVYEYYLCAGRQEGVCELPHLAVAEVEYAIAQEVAALQLTPEEVTAMREHVTARLDARLATEREAHTRLRKELGKLDVQEERLLDLAADGSLATSKLKKRLSDLQVKRAAVRERLEHTDQHLRHQTDTMLAYLTLLERPGAFFLTTTGDVKRKLLAAYFSSIHIDDNQHNTITNAARQGDVTLIRTQARQLTSENKRSTRTDPGAPLDLNSNLDLKAFCSSNANLVAGARFELTTSGL